MRRERGASRSESQPGQFVGRHAACAFSPPAAAPSRSTTPAAPSTTPASLPAPPGKGSSSQASPSGQTAVRPTSARSRPAVPHGRPGRSARPALGPAGRSRTSMRRSPHRRRTRGRAAESRTAGSATPRSAPLQATRRQTSTARRALPPSGAEDATAGSPRRLVASTSDGCLSRERPSSLSGGGAAPSRGLGAGIGRRFVDPCSGFKRPLGFPSAACHRLPTIALRARRRRRHSVMAPTFEQLRVSPLVVALQCGLPCARHRRS